MFQQIQLIGNLGSDPELRYTASGVPVTSMSVAVNKSWTNGDGEKKEKVTWFRVSAWRQLAEAASEYLTKGQRVFVIGEVEEARAFTDKQGNQRASLEVTAQHITFLSSKSGSEQANGAKQAAPSHDDIPH